jgi:hypothetical protein
MCPVCIANIAVIAAGATSTGGLTSLAVRKFYRRTVGKNLENQSKGEENETSREGNESRNRVGS